MSHSGAAKRATGANLAKLMDQELSTVLTAPIPICKSQRLMPQRHTSAAPHQQIHKPGSQRGFDKAWFGLIYHQVKITANDH